MKLKHKHIEALCRASAKPLRRAPDGWTDGAYFWRADPAQIDQLARLGFMKIRKRNGADHIARPTELGHRWAQKALEAA